MSRRDRHLAVRQGEQVLVLGEIRALAVEPEQPADLTGMGDLALLKFAHTAVKLGRVPLLQAREEPLHHGLIEGHPGAAEMTIDHAVAGPLQDGQARPVPSGGLHAHKAKIQGAATAVAHQQMPPEGLALLLFEAMQVIGGGGHRFAAHLDPRHPLGLEGLDEMLALGLQVLHQPDLGDGHHHPARAETMLLLDLLDQTGDELAGHCLGGLGDGRAPMGRHPLHGLTQQHLEVLKDLDARLPDA